MIKNIVDLLELERSYRDYLISHNVHFNSIGRPIFQASMFLVDWPDVIVTYQCRNNAKLVNDPRKTAICFFTADSRIYPRLEKVFEELDEYRRFMAVIGMDLTFTEDMEPELQELILTINQLFTMILAINGIKIVMNTRSGGLQYSSAFNNIPKGITVSSGFLGCNRLSESNFSYISKMLFMLPGRVLIYGKHDLNAEEQLERFGFVYKSYPDVHSRSKNKEVFYG